MSSDYDLEGTSEAGKSDESCDRQTVRPTLFFSFPSLCRRLSFFAFSLRKLLRLKISVAFLQLQKAKSYFEALGSAWFSLLP